MTSSTPRQKSSANRLPKNGVCRQPDHKPPHRPGLFFTLISGFAFLTLAAASLPAGSTDHIDYLTLKMKDDVLKKEMMSGKTMLLPEFEVYDGSGFRIYHSISLPANFQESVQAAFTNGEKETVRLADLESILVTPDGSPLPADAFSGTDYLFVEYWAEWCSACLQQMEQVKKIIQNNPDKNIRWLKVEKDPTKLDSITVNKQDASQPASH